MTQAEADQKMQDKHNKKVEEQLSEQSKQLIAIGTSLELILQSTKSDKESFTEFKLEVKSHLKSLDKKADESAAYMAENKNTVAYIETIRNSVTTGMVRLAFTVVVAVSSLAYLIITKG